MSPDIAVAFARETVDAIRRALVPLRDRLTSVDDALLNLHAKQDELVEARNSDGIVTGKIAAELRSEFDTLRNDLEAMLDARDKHNAGADNVNRTALRAEITQEIAAERTAREALANSFVTFVHEFNEQHKELRGPPGDGFHYRGVFEAAAEYGVGDWVTHDGTLWAAVSTSRALTPGTDEAAAAWRMAMKRPRDGANGVGMNWRGAYADGETYRINDVVRYTGRVFVCRKTTSVSPPMPGAVAASEWALMVEP
jgi:hypothetical protein